jgi:hypothetical protein
LEEKLTGGGVPILERAIRMGSHEGVAEVILIGIAGKTSDWGVVLAHQDILDIFYVAIELLWLVLTIFTNPVEQPAATYALSVRNSRHSMDPLSTSIFSSVKMLGTVMRDSLRDLTDVIAFFWSSTGGSLYS